MKKGLMILLCIAMAGLVLSGCSTRNMSGTTATAAPIVTNSPMTTAQMNAATISPDTTDGMAAGMNGTSGATGTTSVTGTTDTMNNNAMMQSGNVQSMTPAQADRLAERVAEAVERISEIDDAEVVIASDNRVLVAVEFDDQYNAGLDDRMKEMIIQAVQKVDDSVTDIKITDDDTLYGQVKNLGDRLAKATGLDELADDFGDLWNRITGM